jgi:hypothetical protein
MTTEKLIPLIKPGGFLKQNKIYFFEINLNQEAFITMSFLYQSQTQVLDHQSTKGFYNFDSCRGD